MENKYLALLIVFIILLLYFIYGNKVSYEHLTIDELGYNQPSLTGNFPLIKSEGDTSWVRLYGAPWQKNLAFEYAPVYGQFGFLRKIMPIQLKSVDINVPAIANDAGQNATMKSMNPVRGVRIWSMFTNMPTASNLPGFYNSYTEPDFARRANSGKYTLVAQVGAGQRLIANVSEPVKKIFMEIYV